MFSGRKGHNLGLYLAGIATAATALVAVGMPASAAGSQSHRVSAYSQLASRRVLENFVLRWVFHDSTRTTTATALPTGLRHQLALRHQNGLRPPTTSAPTTTTTTSVTTNAPTVSATGAITTGNSKANCIDEAADDGTLAGITTAINNIQTATGVTYNCLETFATGEPAWSDWVDPWVTRYPGKANDGFDAWASEPGHQLILSIDLIPNAVSNNSDPLTWEKACDAGSYNTYATQLAQNLVAEGVGNTVIRLGVEMNGTWENDFVGTTAAEGTAWAQCFAQEVTAMRAVAGAHFQFVWNPNSCYQDFAFSSFYPGNNYVDIIGLDQYDGFCTGAGSTTVNVANFTALEAEPDGLNAIAAFAKQEGKPLALPEWGNVDQKSPPDDTGYGDDPYYIQAIAQWIASNNVAFQSYFDANDDGIVPLSSAYPLTLAAYTAAFG